MDISFKVLRAVASPLLHLPIPVPFLPPRLTKCPDMKKPLCGLQQWVSSKPHSQTASPPVLRNRKKRKVTLIQEHKVLFVHLSKAQKAVNLNMLDLKQEQTDPNIEKSMGLMKVPEIFSRRIWELTSRQRGSLGPDYSGFTWFRGAPKHWEQDSGRQTGRRDQRKAKGTWRISRVPTVTAEMNK